MLLQHSPGFPRILENLKNNKNIAYEKKVGTKKPVKKY